MLKIGLTGGIGSGKSVAGKMFSDLGIITVDADRVSKQITSPGTPLYESILCHFGPSILLDDGNLNRRAMRKTIFNDPAERAWLEQLLHPAIRSVLMEQVQVIEAPYVIVIIPLLVESKKTNFIDRILLIDADESLQIQRASERDDITHDEALSIIKTQSSRTEKIAYADDIIINNGNLEDLKQKVLSLHKFYLSISHEKDA
jgi:dephospho-CoA kinase